MRSIRGGMTRGKARPPKETVTRFRDFDWVVIRESWDDSDAAVLAARAGHNGESHNQLDVGHYVYHVFGESFVHDIGRGQYSKQYFGSSRYDNVFCNAEGHNSIFIDGVGPGVGSQYAGVLGKVKSKPDADSVKMDLTGVYPNGRVESVTRKFVFSRETSPCSLHVTDIVKCKKRAPIEVRIHVGVPMEVKPDGALLTGQRGRVRLRVTTEGAEVSSGCYEQLEGDVARAEYASIVVESTDDAARIEYEFVPEPRCVHLPN